MWGSRRRVDPAGNLIQIDSVDLGQGPDWKGLRLISEGFGRFLILISV